MKSDLFDNCVPWKCVERHYISATDKCFINWLSCQLWEACLLLFNTAVSPTSGTSQLSHILLKSARDYPVLPSTSTGSLGEAFLGFECLLTITVWAPPPMPMGRNTLQHPSVILDTTFLFMWRSENMYESFLCITSALLTTITSYSSNHVLLIY